LFFILNHQSLFAAKIKSPSCDNAPDYSVTAWAGGSFVKHLGKCYRARTVGAAGHQVPWDKLTYDQTSGWDEIKDECEDFGTNCVDCNRNKCLKCKSGFEVSHNGQRCVPVDCSDFGPKCLDCNHNKCLSCRKGFEVSGRGRCVPATDCSDFGAQCLDCNANKCLSCKRGFEVSVKGKCVEIHDCSDFGAKCVDCNANKCTECKRGFEVASNGKCVEANDCSDFPNCHDCNANRCLGCKRGFELSNRGKCVPHDCSDYGNKCTDCNANKCLACKGGWEVSGNGQKCLEACEGTNTWSHGIAFGNQAPWTYRGGDIVKWNGKKYKANWGGQETPGARTCLDEGACRNAGIQWVPVGDC